LFSFSVIPGYIVEIKNNKIVIEIGADELQKSLVYLISNSKGTLSMSL
jgi:hypothetical protein